MRSSARTISFKPNLVKELRQLPTVQMGRVIAKIGGLADNPEPDAKVRKRLKGSESRLHRLRSGDYRVFYTFDRTSVSLYSVRRRSEDTYRAMPEAEGLDHGRFYRDLSDGSGSGDVQRWELPEFHEKVTKLPEPVTGQLLGALRVPPRYHARAAAGRVGRVAPGLSRGAGRAPAHDPWSHVREADLARGRGTHVRGNGRGGRPAPLRAGRTRPVPAQAPSGTGKTRSVDAGRGRPDPPERRTRDGEDDGRPLPRVGDDPGPAGAGPPRAPNPVRDLHEGAGYVRRGAAGIPARR